MKTRGLLVIACALILAGVSDPVTKINAAEKTYVTAMERFDPFGFGGVPVGEYLSFGSVSCPGFEPTGDPAQPCPPGSRTHLRGAKWVSRVDSAEPGVAGWMTVEGNFNYDAAATGPAWGTFSLALDDGGTWDGTWQGVRSQQGSVWIIPLHGSAQGTGGSIDGKQLMVVDRIMDFTPLGAYYVGTIQARILDPRP